MADAIDDQVGVFLPFDAAFPEKSPDIYLLRSLLQQLNKTEMIMNCSLLNLIVTDHLLEGQGTGPERHLRKQWQLVTALFPPSALPRIADFINQHPNFSIIFRGQLIELIRWAALFGQDGESSDEMVTDLKKREIFCKALLIASNLWAERVYRNKMRSDGDLTARRLELLSRCRRSISETGKGPDLTQAFVRGRALIYEGICKLDPKFSESFNSKTGLKVDEYYCCLLLIVLRSLGIDVDPGTERIFARRTFNPLDTVTKEMPLLLSRFMARCSQSAAELTAQLWGEKTMPSQTDFETFDHRVLLLRPVFRIRKDLAIVMDPVWLAEIMATGPLFEATNVEDALRNFGEVFESHCLARLERMYATGSGLTRRLWCVPKGHARGKGEVELADAILDCVDRTAFIETKAVWMREDKIEGPSKDYIAFLRSKYGAAVSGKDCKRKGVAQLAGSIRDFALGNRKPEDKDLQIWSMIVPVLLVYDSLIDAPLHPWFLAREFALLLDPLNVDWRGESIRVGHNLVTSLTGCGKMAE
ncbi:MAG: hypothetical protein ACREQI_03770 [Candidatus Binataceae bacterium]